MHSSLIITLLSIASASPVLFPGHQAFYPKQSASCEKATTAKECTAAGVYCQFNKSSNKCSLDLLWSSSHATKTCALIKDKETCEKGDGTTGGFTGITKFCKWKQNVGCVAKGYNMDTTLKQASFLGGIIAATAAFLPQKLPFAVGASVGAIALQPTIPK